MFVILYENRNKNYDYFTVIIFTIYSLFIMLLPYSAFAFLPYYEKPVITMKNIKLTESSHEKCHQKRRILRVILLRIMYF